MKADDREAEAEPTMQAARAGETGDLEWMSQADDIVGDEPQAEPAGDVPDWLSEMKAVEPEAEAEPTMQAASAGETGDLEWMSQADDIVGDEPQAEPAG